MTYLSIVIEIINHIIYIIGLVCKLICFFCIYKIFEAEYNQKVQGDLYADEIPFHIFNREYIYMQKYALMGKYPVKDIIRRFNPVHMIQYRAITHLVFLCEPLYDHREELIPYFNYWAYLGEPTRYQIAKEIYRAVNTSFFLSQIDFSFYYYPEVHDDYGPKYRNGYDTRTLKERHYSCVDKNFFKKKRNNF